MNTKSGRDLPARIAVALAGTEAEAHAFDTVSALAGNGATNVSFVVIEDSDLLRAAQLPFALEVCRATNVARRINTVDLERTVNERTASLLRVVEQAARRAGSNWTCSVARQSTTTVVLELIASQDVTLLCTAKTFRSPSLGAGRTAPTNHERNGSAVTVVLDRSAASRRAYDVALRIARARGLSITAVIVAATAAGIERIKSKLLRGRNGDPVITELLHPSFKDIAARVRASHPAALVLPVSQLDDPSTRISELESGIDCPTVIVK